MKVQLLLEAPILAESRPIVRMWPSAARPRTPPSAPPSPPNPRTPAAEPPPVPLSRPPDPPWMPPPTPSSPSARRRFAGGSGAPSAGPAHLAWPAGNALSFSRTECVPAQGVDGDGARRRGARNVARSSEVLRRTMPPSRSRTRPASRSLRTARRTTRSRRRAGCRRATLSFTHFGAAGWSITDGATTVLLDLYLTRVRFKGRPYGALDAATVPGDTRPIVAYEEAPTPDTATVDRHFARAHYILLSHSHFNHAMDTPQIARRTGAAVIGTESTANIARAGGVPEAQIFPVRGGEDYAFERLSISVIRSLHWRSRASTTGARPRSARREAASSPEGLRRGRHARVPPAAGRPRDPALRRDDYIEREVDGLRPDIVLVAGGPPTPRDPRRHRPALRASAAHRSSSSPTGTTRVSPSARRRTRRSRRPRRSWPRRRRWRREAARCVPRHFETIVVDPGGRVRTTGP